MVKCPNCGNRFMMRGRYNEILECPSCHSTLKIRAPSSGAVLAGAIMLMIVWMLVLSVALRFGYYYLIILFVILPCLIPIVSSRVEVVQQGNSDLTGRYRVGQRETIQRSTVGQPNRVNRESGPMQSGSAWRYCIYCGSVVSSLESRFCSNCGASLPVQTVERQQLDRGRRVVGDGVVGKCMVCSLGVRLTDAIAYCPHCGNVAHTVHLLQWLYLHKECPACSQHLTEQELT
jgi:uncharacterized protein (DUF983 family)